jgi:hypothetical protein
MTKILRGVVRGKTIELTEELGMWEGQTVDLLVTPLTELPASADERGAHPKTLPGPPPGWKPGAPSIVAGVLADEWSEEDDRLLQQIQADRKAARWRELPE